MQEGMGTACAAAAAERTAALRAEHQRMLQQMMRRVISMRTAQNDSNVVATSPERLGALEAHLRSASLPSLHPFLCLSLTCRSVRYLQQCTSQTHCLQCAKRFEY